mmetsp:Transcript_49835/g.124949  ORF Transcript_49835/g.124949 Transcript_49835/m.124949 type:complete len:218 (-) Transcript_49835:387-1040(-)
MGASRGASPSSWASSRLSCASCWLKLLVTLSHLMSAHRGSCSSYPVSDCMTESSNSSSLGDSSRSDERRRLRPLPASAVSCSPSPSPSPSCGPSCSSCCCCCCLSRLSFLLLFLGLAGGDTPRIARGTNAASSWFACSSCLAAKYAGWSSLNLSRTASGVRLSSDARPFQSLWYFRWRESKLDTSSALHRPFLMLGLAFCSILTARLRTEWVVRWGK